jgi:hypothetical protein
MQALRYVACYCQKQHTRLQSTWQPTTKVRKAKAKKESNRMTQPPPALIIGPFGPIDNPTPYYPPPDDPEQVQQDSEEPSIYWVMENSLQLGYYRIVEPDAFECYVDAGKGVWRQVGIRTNEADAVELILYPPE